VPVLAIATTYSASAHQAHADLDRSFTSVLTLRTTRSTAARCPIKTQSYQTVKFVNFYDSQPHLAVGRLCTGKPGTTRFRAARHRASYQPGLNIHNAVSRIGRISDSATFFISRVRVGSQQCKIIQTKSTLVPADLGQAHKTSLSTNHRAHVGPVCRLTHLIPANLGTTGPSPSFPDPAHFAIRSFTPTGQLYTCNKACWC